MRRIFVLMLIAGLFMTVLVSCRNKDVKEGADPDTLAAQTSSVDAKTNEDKTVSGDESSSVELTTSTLTTTSAKPGTTSTGSRAETSSRYTPKQKNPAVLSKEVENQIKQTHLDELFEQPGFQSNHPDATMDDARIKKYYGSYNGCIAVMMEDKFTEYPQAEWEEIIADIKFRYNDGNKIKSWKDGSFYSLQSAYEKGFLSREDLRNIAYYQNGE